MKKSDLDKLDLPAPIELQADDLAAIAGANLQSMNVVSSVQTAILNAKLARIGVPVEVFQHGIANFAGG